MCLLVKVSIIVETIVCVQLATSWNAWSEFLIFWREADLWLEYRLTGPKIWLMSWKRSISYKVLRDVQKGNRSSWSGTCTLCFDFLLLRRCTHFTLRFHHWNSCGWPWAGLLATFHKYLVHGRKDEPIRPGENRFTYNFSPTPPLYRKSS